MKPVRLRARNLRTFPDLDVRFEPGLVGILGELRDAPEGASSNGAGKSTILEAIDIALFGRRSLAGYLTRGGDVDELVVELEFEHADRVYRVRRTYSARGRGKTSVDLEVATIEPCDALGLDGNHWEPLTRASAKETDTYLCDLVGLSRDTFRDSAYLRQGDGGYADPDRDPRQRKELLVEAVLGRDPIWPRLAAAARARRRASEQQIQRHQGELDRLAKTVVGADLVTAQLEAAAETIAKTDRLLLEAEELYAALSTRYQAAREQAATRQALEAELGAAKETYDRLLEQAKAADEAFGEVLELSRTLAALDARAARLPEVLADAEQLREQQAAYDQAFTAARDATLRRNDLLGRANEANEKAEQLRMEASMLDARPLDDGARCDHCGQTLDAEARTQRLAKYQADADRLDAEAKTLDEQAAAVEIPAVPDPPTTSVEDPEPLRQASIEAARVREKIKHLETVTRPDAGAITEAHGLCLLKQDALDQLEPVSIDAIAAEGVNVKATLDELRGDRERALTEKARLEERHATIKAAQARQDELGSAITQVQAAVDRDVLLERAYGRDGIPALIIENTAIPYLETEASRILALLGTSFQVELRTQAETKTGELRDTLDVVVIDQDANEADYADGCSGGEQTRIGLALRIALARLLAHRRGAESRLLALDEPSYLDAAGMTALLDVLRGLAGEFDLVLLVSHVAELRDSLDETITVVKEHGRSRIVGALPVEVTV